MKVTTLRGADGTGLLQGRFNRVDGPYSTYFIEKAPVEVNRFLHYHEKTKDGNHLVLLSTMDNVFMAHCRYATMGSLTKDNTHPFETEPGKADKGLVGMHNGTLKDFKYIPPVNRGTDSELLLQDISNRGAIPVLSELDPESAYALIWIDKNTGDMFFARNKHRTLFVAFHKNRKVMYWNSEYGALEWILGRHNISYDKISYFAENQLYTLHPLDIKESGGFTDVKDIPFAFVTLRNIPNPPKKKKNKHDRQQNLHHGVGKKDQKYYDDLPWGDVGSTGTGTGNNILQFDQSKAASAIKSILRKLPANPNQSAISVPSIPRERPKVPHYNCLSCGRELGLSDQYYADKTTTAEGITIFECRECADLLNTLQDDMDVIQNEVPPQTLLENPDDIGNSVETH